MMSRPRPVLTSAGIGGLITSAAGILTFLGYNDASAKLSAMATTITAVAIFAVSMGSHLLAGAHAQARVTPMVAPQDHDGTPLVRIDALQAPAETPLISPQTFPAPAPAPVAVGVMEDVEAAPSAPSAAT